MHEIPFTQSRFVVPDDTIPGNTTSPTPVVFHLSPAGGGDLARIKSALVATIGLTSPGDWGPDLQESVIRAFGTAEGLFARTVDRIENLYVPHVMAVKAGLVDPPADPKPGDPPINLGPVPIRTGEHFAKISGFVSSLALLVTFEISKLSRKLEELDPRFSGQPSGSGTAATPGGQSGTVARARRRRAARATAD